MTQLTDAEIDGLSGRALDEAVCLALGWTWCKRGKSIVPELVAPDNMDDCVVCKRPKPESLAYVSGKWGMPWTPFYHTDLGEAMLLLMGLEWLTFRLCGTPKCGIRAKWVNHSGQWEEIATGPKSEAASVICRAYLKLVNRGT